MKLRVKEYHRPVVPVALVFVFIGVALARQVTSLTYGYSPAEGDDITLIAPTPTMSRHACTHSPHRIQSFGSSVT